MSEIIGGLSPIEAIDSSPRSFVVGGDVSFMSIVAVAVLQLTLIAIIFLIFYYYWFLTTVTQIQQGFGGHSSRRSLRHIRSIFGLPDNVMIPPLQGQLNKSGSGLSKTNDDEDSIKLAQWITSAIERGASFDQFW